MKKIRWIAASAALIVFIITACFIHSGSQLAFDTAVQKFFFAMRCDWLDPVVIALTHLGDTRSIVIICAVLLVLPWTFKHYGLPVACAAITASSLNHYLKSVFERPRPDEVNFLIEQGGWSFPSGHSISALVVFGLLILLIRRNVADRRKANILTALLLIPCFGIGLSRIYVGVHYPTDVLAGWCLGVIVITVILEIMETVKKAASK